MTVDELFEQLKITDKDKNVESYKNDALAGFRRKFINDKIEQRARALKMDDFYRTLNGNLYDKYKHNGVPYIIHTYYQEDDKNEYLKKTFNEIFSKEEQEEILVEAESITLDNLKHVILAPKELDDAINASTNDKEFLQEVKNVVFQSVDERYKEYYTELIKRIESISIKESDNLIIKNKDNQNDEFAREANKILYVENANEVTSVMFDSNRDLNARKKVFDYMMNPEKIKGNTSHDKQVLKQIIQILNDRLYDGQEIDGEEGIKIYSARRFYDSFIKIKNICSKKEIDIEALRSEYSKYKQYKKEYDDVVTEVSKLLDGKGFAGNMDLSRTNYMPDSFVKNFETISVMNGVWVLMGYIKQSNLSVDEFLDNPFINATKLLREEKNIDYNNIFDKNDLKASLNKVMSYKLERPLNFYSLVRAISNCFILNTENPGPNIYEKIYTELLAHMSHGYDFNSSDNAKMMANLYLLGHSSDEIDYNFLFAYNDIDYDKLEIVPNDDGLKIKFIMDLEAKKHVSLSEIKDRLDGLKDIFKDSSFTLFDLNPIYNKYLNKYIASFDFNDLEEAARIKNYTMTGSYDNNISVKNVISILKDNVASASSLRALLNYANAKAFKELPIDTINIAQTLREAFDNIQDKEDLEPLMNEFELKANGEILFTAFNNTEQTNIQKRLINSDISMLDDLLKSRNFEINNDLLKGIVLSMEIDSPNRYEALAREVDNVAGSFEEGNYNQYLERYYNYVNNDIRELKDNVNDIRKALVMKDAYKNISIIKNEYASFLSNKVKSKEDSDRFNISMYKMHEYQKLLNDNFDDIDILQGKLQGKNQVTKLSSKYSAVFGKDKNLATKAAIAFFEEAVALNTNYTGDIRLIESGFKNIDKIEFRIFIGGRSLNEICKEKYPNKSINEAKGEVLLNALLKPKNPIELANYNNDYEVKTLKIDFTEGKLNSKYYSKTRKLFKGIAPIRPNHTYEKTLEESEAHKQVRQKNIKSKFMEYALASKMQKIQDATRRSISIPKDALSNSNASSVDLNLGSERNKNLTK